MFKGMSDGDVPLIHWLVQLLPFEHGICAAL
jgi:hypothetical protein